MSGGRRRRPTMSGSAPPQQAEVDQMDHTHVLVTALRLCDTSLLYPPAIYLTVHRHVCAPASVYFHQLQKKLSVQPEVLRQGGDDLLRPPQYHLDRVRICIGLTHPRLQGRRRDLVLILMERRTQRVLRIHVFHPHAALRRKSLLRRRFHHGRFGSGEVTRVAR